MAYTQQDAIKEFMASLDKTSLTGNAAVDEAVRKASKNKFSSAQDVIDHMLSDRRKSGNGDSFKKDYCGIIIGNEDTGAITGSDAGGSATKTAESVVLESAALDTTFDDDEFTVKGLTIKIGNGLKFTDLTSYQQRIYQALRSWWVPSAMNLIEESFGYKFTDRDVTVNTMELLFINDESRKFLAETGFPNYYRNIMNNGNGQTKELTLTINLAYAQGLSFTDENGAVSGGQEYLDRTVVHELTHAIMGAKINYLFSNYNGTVQGLPLLVLEGAAELVHGIDDTRTNDLNTLVSNVNTLEKALVLKPSANSVDGVYAPDYVAGYTFLRYLAKQSADSDSSIVNTASNTLISGTSAADYITNNGAKITIRSGEGNDTIRNEAVAGVGTGNSVSIDAGDGNDVVSLNGSYYVTVNGGFENDTIYDSVGYKNYLDGSYGNDVISVNSIFADITIAGGYGNDTIYSENSGARYFIYDGTYGSDIIYGAKASDTIKIIGGTYKPSTVGSNLVLSAGSGAVTLVGAANVSLTIDGTLKPDEPDGVISLTSGDDTHTNTLSGVTIYALGGNDRIGDGVSISGGDGADYLDSGYFNSSSDYGGKRVTISGGNGNDTIFNHAGGDSVKIYGEAGIDSIVNHGSNMTIDGGAGDDSIQSYGNSYVSIFGGAGNDKITVGGNASTVRGGAGNDFITDTNSGTVGNVYVYESGNDTISGANSYDTLKIASGTYSLSGSIVSVFSGESVTGTIRLVDSANVQIDGTLKPDDNVINNYTKNTTVSGTSGNDTINNYAGGAKIYGGGGNDYIYSNVNTGDTINYAYGYVTIDGGAGNDSITNWDPNVSISGGAGNDYVTLNGSYGNITVNGGAGNDYIHNSNSAHSGARIYIYSGGNDTISGANSSDTLKITDGTYSLSGSIVSVFSGDNVTGTIRLDNSANVKIDGTIKPVLPSGWKYGAKTNTNSKILTATIASASATLDATQSYGSGVSTINASIISASTSITGNALANSIKGGKGADCISSGSGNDTIYGGSGNDILNGEAGNDKVSGEAGNDTLYGADGNDSLSGGAGNDVLIGGHGNDTLTGGAGNDTFWHFDNDGDKDVITDYAAGQDKIQLAYGASIKSASLSGSDVVFVFDNSQLTVKNGKDKAITILDAAGKETTQIYPTIPVPVPPSGWKYGTSAASNHAATIMSATLASAGDLDLTEEYGEGVKRVDASKTTSGIAIIGNDEGNSIKGGRGADTIYGGFGDDTVSLGGGADVYIYSGGDDLIQDYNAVDTIQFAGGISLDAQETLGTSVIIITDVGDITVKGGKSKNIVIADEEGERIYPYSPLPNGWKYGTTATTNTAATLMSATVASADDLDLNEEYGEGVKNVNAAKTTGGIAIIGNDLSNSMKGGSGADYISGGDGNDTLYGGAGNDTIFGNDGTNKIYGDAGNDYLVGGWGVDTVSGGAGNDTLYGQTGNDSLSGGAGNDVLIGGNGNDTLTGGAGNDTFYHYDNSGDRDWITDYAAGQDKIRLGYGASIKSANLSGTNVVFTFDNSTLTVRNGKGKKITVIDSAGKETTKIYSSNGNAAVPWFAEDDTNFISGGAQLDDIAAEKFSVTEIETPSSFETLAQAAQLSLAAYCDK